MRTAMALVLVLLFAGVIAAQPSRHSLPACSADTTAGSALRGWVVALVAPTVPDSDQAVTRDSVRLVPVAANQVIVVSIASTCTSARNSLAPLLGVSANTLSVVVVKVGSTRYVVQDPTQRRGEYIPTVTFNARFGLLKSYTY